MLSFKRNFLTYVKGAYEYLVKKSNGHDLEVSRLFIYYNARVRAHGPNVIVDCGCSMTDAIEALEQFGTCLESIWPYNLSRVNTHPSSYAYEQAKNHRINKAMKLNVNLNEMKSCLAQGFPFAFSLKIYPSFEKAMKNGIVPVPIEWEDDEESIGRYSFFTRQILIRFFLSVVIPCWQLDIVIDPMHLLFGIPGVNIG